MEARAIDGVPDDKLFKVDGLVAVVTGAGSGLGRTMARALAENGAEKVYVFGRRLAKLEETAQGYGNILPIQGDVTDKFSLKAAADRVKQEVGFVHVLICNSGTVGPGVSNMPENPSITQVQEHFFSYDQDDMTKTFALNNVGSFFTMVAFLELLDAGNRTRADMGVQSQVIFTASLAGLSRALSTGVAYVSSKAGVIQLTKMFSTYLAKHNIRVNALAPGIYPSEMTKGSVGRAGFSVDTIPAHRLGASDDIKGAILFLTSRAGAYINGLILISDGGRLSQLPSTY